MCRHENEQVKGHPETDPELCSECGSLQFNHKNEISEYLSVFISVFKQKFNIFGSICFFFVFSWQIIAMITFTGVVLWHPKLTVMQKLKTVPFRKRTVELKLFSRLLLSLTREIK